MHAAEPPEAAEAAASYGPRQQLRHRIRRVMSLADRASKVRRVTASHAFIVYRCKMQDGGHDLVDMQLCTAVHHETAPSGDFPCSSRSRRQLMSLSKITAAQLNHR